MPRLRPHATNIPVHLISQMFEDDRVFHALMDIAISDLALIMTSRLTCGHQECRDRFFEAVMEALDLGVKRWDREAKDIKAEVKEENAAEMAEAFIARISKCSKEAPE